MKINKNMLNKKAIIIVLLILLVAFIIYQQNRDIKSACFNNECFKVDIADSSKEKEIGLSETENLDSDRGMLFVFDDDGNYLFWMKDMNFPIDIIWIDSEMKIVYIEKNAQPCAETCAPINPNANSRYVLEINAGLSEQHNLSIGDYVNFKY